MSHATGQGLPTITRWNNSAGKRVLDLGVTLLLAPLWVPLLGVLALIVRLSSGSPVLFRQERCAQGDGTFQLLKFRSMRNHDGTGPQVTSSGDPRITPIGRILRKTKLDELPQLVNVVRGDLSLVGPRPELPLFMSALGADVIPLRQLKPGLTGWASLHYRNEEELLAAIPPEARSQYYDRVLVPEKARLDLAYAAKASFFTDIALMFQTVLVLFQSSKQVASRSRAEQDAQAHHHTAA